MILWRIRIFIFRLIHYFITIPNRLFHLLKWFTWLVPIPGNLRFIRWFVGLLLLIIDLTPINLIYETLLDWIKWKTRSLTDRERAIVLTVFGNSIPYHLIGLDPRSIPAIRRKTAAYVSFHTINFADEISDTMLVHEMVHIWQYEQYGAVYISEAFWAQRWGGGYNYGGIAALELHVYNLGLQAFNFEQQADIIEDYFRWTKNLPLQWAVNEARVGEVLEKYCEQVRGVRGVREVRE